MPKKAQKYFNTENTEIANKFLSQYMLKLKDSGYSAKFRAEIIKSAKNAFNLQIQNDSKGIRPLFRDKNRIIQDQKEKGVGSVDWWNKAYYKDPKNKKYSTIITPKSPITWSTKLCYYCKILYYNLGN